MEGGFHSIKSQSYSQPGQANANANANAGGRGFSASQYRQAQAAKTAAKSASMERTVFSLIAVAFVAMGGWAATPHVMSWKTSIEADKAQRRVAEIESRRLHLASTAAHEVERERNIRAGAVRMRSAMMQGGSLDNVASNGLTASMDRLSGVSYGMQKERHAFTVDFLGRCGILQKDALAEYRTRNTAVLDRMGDYEARSAILALQTSRGTTDALDEINSIDPGDPAAIARFVAGGGMRRLRASHPGGSASGQMAMFSMMNDLTKSAEDKNWTPPPPPAREDCDTLGSAASAGRLDLSLDG